ncbi:MAG: 4-hydroxy-tetrahydrodipicolinate reductase [Firmicutes bacterium]|nr:4-hydroxy-tetrahydrodipicolinate reductase [Bacillota bacterium]
MKIKTIVTGIAGRMGKQVASALIQESDIELVGGVDLKNQSIPVSSGDIDTIIEVTTDLSELIEKTRPSVLVDFTHPSSVMNNIRIALQAGVRCVVGTTGISSSDFNEINDLCKAKKTGAVVAPNFSIGAVLLMKFAHIASKHFDSAEIIEMHHNEKVDAPSGTALRTAEFIEHQMLAASRQTAAGLQLQPARGEDVKGTRIHSVRLPGLIAHHEVIFGKLGEILTIRHDSLSRESFMPGVILAVKEVMKLDKAVLGLDALLTISGVF